MSDKAGQIVQSGPGTRHEFTLGMSDFNHNQQLPGSTLIRLSSEARFIAFTTWPALAKLVEEDESVDVSVKVQMLRTLRPHKLFPGATLTVTQTPHAIGTNSLTLAYDFYDGDKGAFAQLLTVMVRLKDGTPLP